MARRSELERTDASVDAGPKDDASQDEMLMREVHLPLKRQAELAGNLAEVRREKDMLEKENELLLDQPRRRRRGGGGGESENGGGLSRGGGFPRGGEGGRGGDERRG